jgi:hypothetical protein
MTEIISYIVLGFAIGVSLLTVYFAIGITILYVLEGIFDRLCRRHRDASIIGNYDKMARLSDRMGTVAKMIDRVENAILFV